MRKTLACLTVCLCLLFTGGLPAIAVQAAPDDATEIWTRADLEAMAQNPAGRYRLMAHIDMGGGAWQPIPFDGHFDGGGFTLYNLTIRAADPQTAVSVDGNRKPYDTVFAALFSRCNGAVIENLNLRGISVVLEADQNAYAAALVGYGENVTLTGCGVSGRVALTTPGAICGVAGLMGFGYGTISGCSASVELVLVDSNDTANCEEFMGAVLASGYADIEDCTVALSAYTSVHGYAHNGGVVGMYYVHTDDTGHAGFVRSNTVDATIRFFEDVASRRAYSAPVIGEQMHWVLEIADNTVERFESIESDDYTTPLLPETCAAPSYAEAVTPPDCAQFGYTAHTCAHCDYRYTDSITAPAHTPGPWQTVAAPAAGQNGLMEQHCTLCGVLLEQQAIIPAAACTLRHSTLALAPGETAQLTATLQPADATDTGLVFASSDETVATVDATGLVTAHKAGSATITCASADGFATAACDLTVAAPFPLVWVIIGVVALVVIVAIIVAVAAARRRKKRRARQRTYRRGQ